MNQPIPNALANTVLLADHDEAIQQQVVHAVEMIIVNYLKLNLNQVSADIVGYQQNNIERFALRALRQHLVNASNIY